MRTVSVDAKLHETLYDGIHESVYYEKFGLNDPNNIEDALKRHIKMLENERTILSHFMINGYTHIEDPNLNNKRYRINDHLNLIYDELFNLYECLRERN